MTVYPFRATAAHTLTGLGLFCLSALLVGTEANAQPQSRGESLAASFAQDYQPQGFDPQQYGQQQYGQGQDNEVVEASYCEDGSCGGESYGNGYCDQGYGDQGYCSSDYCGDQCYSSCGGGCGEQTGCCRCPCPPCHFVFAEALFLRATGNDVAHAQQQNGIGGAGTVPFGDIGVVDHDWNAGVRAGFGCCLDACSDLVVSYTFFQTDGGQYLEPPVVPGGGGAIGSLVHHPGAAITASAGPVNATQDIDFQLADIMYRHILHSTPNSEINYSLGGQYGHLEQGFTQTGVFSGGNAGTIDTASNITFDGGGLKAGLDGERRIAGGFSIHSRLGLALMSGQFQSRYSMVNSTTEVQLAQANWKEDRVISQVEYELGLGWTSCSGHCHARVGYLISNWGNVVTMPTFIDAVQANNYTDVEDSITFDGAVARIEYRW